MFMNDPDYVPSVFVFSINKDKRSHYERLIKRIRNKAAEGCSHKNDEVPPPLQTPSNSNTIEQATNNVPYATESIEDNMLAEENGSAINFY